MYDIQLFPFFILFINKNNNKHEEPLIDGPSKIVKKSIQIYIA